MISRPKTAVVATFATAALLTSAFSGAPATAQRTGEQATGRAVTTSAAPRVPGVDGKNIEVVAVGDLVCPPGAEVTATTCRHEDTARVTEKIDPDAVLVLGDTQYDTGALRAYRRSYDESWGAFKGITYPAPGNHEYKTEGAEGYYTYFRKRQPGAPGYYATNLGRWRMYGLNSNCSEIDCDKQLRWLVQDIKDHPRTCSLFTMHHPRYSSGEHGSDGSMRQFFRVAFRNQVDLVLAGHDHHYERFRPMNHQGELRKRGVTEFVSGGGGKSHYAADGDVKGSAFVENDTFGVLRLVLSPDSFRYEFRGVDGSTQDEGTQTCV